MFGYSGIGQSMGERRGWNEFPLVKGRNEDTCHSPTPHSVIILSFALHLYNISLSQSASLYLLRYSNAIRTIKFTLISRAAFIQKLRQ